MTFTNTLKTATLALAAAAVSTLALTGAASATYKSKHYGYGHGAAHAAHKYQAARNSGSITWLEGIRVRRSLNQYRALRSAYQADGRLTYSERKALNAKLRDVNRTVYRASHNRYRRLGLLPRFGN